MTYLPEVKISTQENVTLTVPGAPAVIAIMGTAQWGEEGTVQTFSSFANLLAYYQADADGLTLVKGADIAYTNGAYIVKAIRVADASAAKSSYAFDGNSGAELGVLTFEGKYKGTYGDNIAVTILTQGSGRIVTVTDGTNTESYTNNNAVDGYTTNADIASAINSSSSLVSVTVKTGSETTNLVDAYSATYLTGGNDGSSPSASDYTTAFDNALYQEDFDVLVIPGQSSDSFQTTMVGKLNTRANTEKKYSIYVTGVAADESVSTQKARTASGDRLVLVSPSMYYTPSYSTSEITLDGSYLGCAVAGVLASNDVEIAPTRKTVSVSDLIYDSTTGKKYYDNSQMEELLAVGIVPISNLGGQIKIARGVTRVGDPTNIYYEINIRRIVDYVKKQMLEKLDSFLGDPNLERIRQVIARECDGVLEQDKLDEVIADYNPTEVVVGPSPDTIIVNMSLQPTFAINYINVTLAINRLE